MIQIHLGVSCSLRNRVTSVARQGKWMQGPPAHISARLVLSVLLALANPLQAADAPPKPVPTAVNAGNGPAVPVVKLTAGNFLKLLVMRSLDVQYSRLNANIAKHNEAAEAALYEPAEFVSLRREGRYRQRSLEELQQNSSSITNLDEANSSEEIGLHGKIPSGAEVSLSYKLARKRNNLIPQNSLGLYDSEFTGLLSLTLKQPLLRNAGRNVTETDKRVAELESRAALQQLMQQTLKTSIDGLTLYWQLHRAQETARLRQDALDASESLLADTQSRISAGRTAASTLLEVQGVILNRKAELVRSMQALREAQSKLLTAINLVADDTAPASTTPQWHSPDQTTPPATDVKDQILSRWPPYQIALIRQEQARIRLDFAQNQIKPSLDLVMSYGATGLGYDRTSAVKSSTGGRFPDWFVGLNLELPMRANQKAQEQYLAQAQRLEQAALELVAIDNAFSNDLSVRMADLRNAQTVFELSRSEVELRQKIFEHEQQRIQIGSGSISSLIQKHSDLIEARQRLLENQIRYEVALASWQYTNGTLLIDNNIEITAAAM
jgi:outer membrane protein TolC